MIPTFWQEHEERNHSKLSKEQKDAAMKAAKVHMRDCVARDAWGDMQQLKTILAGFITPAYVQEFLNLVKPKWAKIRSEYLETLP